MSAALVFFIELFVLFLLSHMLTKKLSRFFYRISRSAKTTIYLLAFLFFPGTLLHELSHFFMAQILFVPVGHMEFVPKLEGNGVKLGSVSIAHTDIFRRLLIGMAPFFFGTSILLATLFFAAQNNLFEDPLFIVIIGYTVFEIGNTMFSSKKDLEGAIELLLALFVISTVLYFAGVRLPALNTELFFAHPLIKTVFEKGSLFLLIPLCLDLLVIGLLKFFRH